MNASKIFFLSLLVLGMALPIQQAEAGGGHAGRVDVRVRAGHTRVRVNVRGRGGCGSRCGHRGGHGHARVRVAVKRPCGGCGRRIASPCRSRSCFRGRRNCRTGCFRGRRGFGFGVGVGVRVGRVGVGVGVGAGRFF